uniref:Diaminopimelate decarboxylase n=1 Tax=Dictyoglomus thermophilum TaxID=14 RepID=A0A7C3MKC2_DICTH
MQNKIYPETFHFQDEWKIDGISIKNLAEKYGTPLYVIDKKTLITQAQKYINSWKKYYKNKFKVLFAIKALPILEVIRIFYKEGLGFLVSTGGELFIARSAGVDSHKIYFHGNAKSIHELEYAIKENIGAIIIDNFDEYEKIKFLTDKHSTSIKVLIRLIPNIEVSTHKSIRTGQIDTKFGLPINQVYELIERIRKEKYIDFKGLHAHIGSQIFDISAYVKLAEVLSEIYNNLKSANTNIEEMSIGGGLGIAYTKDDNPPEIEDLAYQVSQKFEETIGHHFTLICEPGRSLVGRAGITIYKIESRKEIPGIRKYVSVDGGMSDNIRPSLYGAKYSALLITSNESTNTIYTIAGKHCESGDILIRDFEDKWPNYGDYLITFSTGAYNFSMFTWYNATVRPGVVLIENGKDRLIVKRDTYEDLLRGQI